MPKETIINSKIWPRIGLDHAPPINLALLNNMAYKAQFATQFLLYDRIVVPTNDFAIVPILTQWMGLPSFYSALESDSLRFIRLTSILGYVGNGNALNLFTIKEGTGKPFEWWQNAMFGKAEDALEVQLGNAQPSIPLGERKNLYGLVMKQTDEFSMPNEDFMSKVVHESYRDILDTPTLKKEIVDYYKSNPIDLTRLPEVKADQVRVSGIEVLNDPVDLVLRVAEVNFEIVMANQAYNADLYTSERIENLLKSKMKRSGIGTDVLNGFIRLLNITNVPNLEMAIESGNLGFEDLWEIRSSNNSSKFRAWLREAREEHGQDLGKAYVSTLESIPFIDSLPIKTIRFLITTCAGLIEPLTGLTTGVIDSFFVQKWLAGYSPRLFIDDLRKLSISKEEN